MPTAFPGPAFQWRSGEYVVMPAHSSGATPARFFPSCLTRRTNDSLTTMVSE